MRPPTLFFAALLAAGCTTEPPVDAADLPYVAQLVPDRIVLSWNADPASTQSVTWRTSTAVPTAHAEYAIATDGPEFRKRATRVAATTTRLASDAGPAHYHSATFTGLREKTRYCYRVGDGEHWSEWSHFTTASRAPEPFSFVYFGDAQNDLKAHWSRVVREGFMTAPRAAFLLHAGDLVNRSNRDREWGEWFYGAGWILRTVPSIATPGNHEYARETEKSKRKLTRHWRPTFTFPENGPPGLEETVYWLDYQGARIVSLNTNAPLQQQVDWLDEAFAAAGEHGEPRWKIVTMHHPVFATARKRDSTRVREALQPAFDRHAVDIVLQGHDHSYGRSGRMRHDDRHLHGDGDGDEHNEPVGVRAQSGQSGTVYVVSVSGPKMYPLDDKPVFVRATDNKQLFQIVTVTPEQLRYSAFTATGQLFDQFELQKGADGVNELVETFR